VECMHLLLVPHRFQTSFLVVSPNGFPCIWQALGAGGRSVAFAVALSLFMTRGDGQLLVAYLAPGGPSVPVSQLQLHAEERGA
jgi:hypothetical protein